MFSNKGAPGNSVASWHKVSGFRLHNSKGAKLIGEKPNKSAAELWRYHKVLFSSLLHCESTNTLEFSDFETLLI